MTPAIPLTRDLVLIGGGHAHALVLRSWAMAPLPGVRLTVINPGPTAPYTGMLPGFVAGHYLRDELDIDLVRLARFAGARLILSRATGIDRARRLIRIKGRPDLGYDLASLDIGITSEMEEIPGFCDHAVPAKPLGAYSRAWESFAANPGEGRIAVIGGGVAGCELALAMHHALASRGRPCAITVIEAASPLAGLGAAAARALLAQMKARGIRVLANQRVAAITATDVTLDNGEVLASDFTLGAAGARPQGWLKKTGLELHKGFVTVGPTLQSSDPYIFAVGDCAHMEHAPRPKAGVFAVRQAPVLLSNLRAALTGAEMTSFTPQRDYLKLISLGEKSAMAEKFGLKFQGHWLWKLKDRIDRAFMDKFTGLSPMPAPGAPDIVADGVRDMIGDQQMPCSGCGAKLGAEVLGGALSGLPPPRRSDVHALPGDDAAVLKMGDQTQVITTDHLNAFTADTRKFARIAAQHALGDIWAMGARPQAALAQVTLARMSPELQRRTLDEIMTALSEVVTDAGADIVGGHTTQGAETMVGLTITGLAGAAPITLRGAKPGDALILTKPLGSGTILAGEMALKARGSWVADCLDQMDRSQEKAAGILAKAHAMTDVTGFGLARHLLGLCRASGVSARVSLQDVPLMAGALELAEAGQRSTLYPDNRAAAGGNAPATPRAALCFDPQTSGGLLAAVAGDTAPDILDQLRAAGYPAAIIGQITKGPESAVTLA